MALTLDGTNGIVSSGSITTQSATGVIFSDSSSLPAASSPYVLKNRIINGAMVIDQRNAGASVTPANGNYTLDRWQATVFSAASKFSIQQNAGSVTPPTGFRSYLGATSLSAYSVTGNDIYAVGQPIEGFNIADLGWGTANASPVTISFWVRSSLTGTFAAGLSNQTRSYPFTYTITSANTWEQKSVTIAGDTSGTWNSTNGIGVALRFGLGAGSSSIFVGPANAWASADYYVATGGTSVVGTNGATFYITGVQLEIGTSATPFERRLYDKELISCQRYFEISGAAGATSNPNYHGTLYDPTSTLYLGQIQFQVTKRTAPTITVGAGSTGAASTIGISSFFFTRSAAAAYLTYWTASAEL